MFCSRAGFSSTSIDLEKNGRMQKRIKSVFVYSIFLILLSTSMIVAQTPAGYAQQVFVMTKLMPSVKSIGIISSKATDQFVQSVNRAGLSLGIKVFIAKAKSTQEIPKLYRMLLKNEVKIIWLPDKDDAMLLDLGFEYLREITLEDKIGLCVPVSTMVPEGGLCSIQIEENKVTVYLNRRIAQIVGANIPDEPNSTIKYVLK